MSEKRRATKIGPGDRFFNLTCVRWHHTGKRSRNYYLWRCDCGREAVILGTGVASGNTKSCGCLVKKVARDRILPNSHAAITQAINHYRSKCKASGRQFLLTREQMVALFLGNCHYCGAEPSNRIKSKHDSGDFIYNGIDRVNTAMGYTIENCVSCCPTCNRAKLAMSKGEFLSWVRRIYAFQFAMADQWNKVLQ